MTDGQERSDIEDEVRRRVEEVALPEMTARRRAELHRLAREALGGSTLERAGTVNDLVARAVEREMEKGAGRLDALAVAVAEAILVLREWEWLDLIARPPEGTG